jgi:putative transposase
MARTARVVAVGEPHHVTQRGNNRQEVFLSDEDRQFYLATLAEGCRRYEITVLGYCLMTNHVHLVAIPGRPDSLSGGVGGAHRRYTEYVHRRYRRSGHLWQNRFSLDRDHLLLALAYVDQNPVRAAMVNLATEYTWSSARAHVMHDDSSGLLDMTMWGEIDRANEWAEVLEVVAEKEQVAALRSATNTGRPWGEEEFLLQLSAATGRELAAPRRPLGGPVKAAGATP